MGDSGPHSSLVPSLKPQITGASRGGMFSLEGPDCLCRLWAEAGGAAHCSSSNRVISSVILAPPVYQSAISRPHIISCYHLEWLYKMIKVRA